MSDMINEEMGCIIFIKPEGDRGAPGVAVFTESIDEINDAVKRTVHFDANDSELRIKEFGVNYCVAVNTAARYIQLPKSYSDILRKHGEVAIPHNRYRILKQERRC